MTAVLEIKPGSPATQEAPLSRRTTHEDSPLVVAVDHGMITTRVRVQSNDISSEKEYPTPTTYQDVLDQLSQTKEALIGSKRPYVTVLSVAGSVSMVDGKPQVDVAGELHDSVTGSFVEGVTAAINGNPEALLVFSQGTAGAYAEMTAPHRREQIREEAFYTWDGHPDGAMYSPEHRIFPDRLDQNESRDVVNGMQLILQRHGEIQLFVARIALAAPSPVDESMIHTLNHNAQSIRRPTLAPKIVQASSGEKTPLIGAARAGYRLATKDQRPKIVYSGLRKPKTG